MKKSILFVCIIVLGMVLMSARPSKIMRMPIVKYTDEAMGEAINEIISDNFKNESLCLMFYRDSHDSTKIKFTVERDFIINMTQCTDVESFSTLRILGMQVLSNRNKIVIYDHADWVDVLNKDSFGVDYLPENHNLYYADSAARPSKKSLRPFRLDEKNNVVIDCSTYGDKMLIFADPVIRVADLVRLDSYDIVDEDLSSDLKDVFEFIRNDKFANYVCNFEIIDGGMRINVISQPKAAIIDSDIWGCAEYDGKNLLLSGTYNDSTAFVANGRHKYFVSTDYNDSDLEKYYNFIPVSIGIVSYMKEW